MAAVASANWLALKQTLPKPQLHGPPRKKRRIETFQETRSNGVNEDGFVRGHVKADSDGSTTPVSGVKLLPMPSTAHRNGESVAALRSMVSGENSTTPSPSKPGRYVSIDCEMVGVGPEGAESALARVSVVDYHGGILLDAFVRPAERVVDYRTAHSGIRPEDMINARTFEEVQKEVAMLLDGNILVGHAVHNDLKALLLSHSHTVTRDTQTLAHKHKTVKSRRVALRHLVQQELGLAIQGGEHSSVVDARATMAVYRLHRKQWDQGLARPSRPTKKSAKGNKGTDSAPHHPSHTTSEEEISSKAGRKGISSGLSTVIKRRNPAKMKSSEQDWWQELGGGSKRSIRLRT